YCFAVTSVRKDSVTISPALSGTSTVSKKDLSALANGTFYLVWQNVGQIPESLALNEKRYEVRSLQQLLKRASVYHGDINGSYDTSTVTAVREFQRSSSLPPVESPGRLTLAALTRFEAGRNIPLLSSNGNGK
ncbi:MAG: peptidoglycan-binding domain-containing protein, partial [Pelobacteraceae bacterium]